MAKDVPTFDSVGIGKTSDGMVVWCVELKEEVWNLDQYTGDVLIDGKMVYVQKVNQPRHMPPFCRGEEIGLVTKTHHGK